LYTVQVERVVHSILQLSQLVAWVQQTEEHQTLAQQRPLSVEEAVELVVEMEALLEMQMEQQVLRE
jgi:hypothetical protein